MNEKYTPHEAVFPAEGAPALWGMRDPQIELKSEQPWHRLLLYFKSKGLSNKKCAAHLQAFGLGTSAVYVGQIVRQPWFQRALVHTLQQEGLPAVQEMIRGAAAESVLKLIELRDSAARQEVQRDCAMDLLDRYLGKAPQLSAPEADPLSKVDEKRLDAEIEELMKKLSPASEARSAEPGLGPDREVQGADPSRN